MAVQTTVSNREFIIDEAATLAHVFDAYPRRVEAVAEVVLHHLEQDAANGGSGEYASAGTMDEGLARFERLARALVGDPKLREIGQQLATEYTPPPYTRLPSDTATEGEPVSLVTAALAVGLAMAAGAAIGSVIPL
jgi:hypothetical protein